MHNSSFIKPRTRAAFGIFLNRKGEILIGEDRTGRIAVPGGKFEPIDRCNPILALRRETPQEVGKKFRYRHIHPRPHIFCTGKDVHTVIHDPTPADNVDLRFFYLLEALNDKVVESEPGEFNNPRFVDLAYLDDKVLGEEIRYAAGHALGLFHADGSLTNGLFNPADDMDYDYVRTTLNRMGFGPKFAKIHSRPPTLPKDKAEKILPKFAKVTDFEYRPRT